MVVSDNFFIENSSSYILSFDKLAIKVHLGVTDKERKNSQEIYLSLKVLFKAAPKACFNDDITDTICYDEIANIIKEFCVNKEFNLLEYLTYQLYQLIKAFINDSDIKIWLRVDKHPNLMTDLLGAASFTYHD